MFLKCRQFSGISKRSRDWPQIGLCKSVRGEPKRTHRLLLAEPFIFLLRQAENRVRNYKVVSFYSRKYYIYHMTDKSGHISKFIKWYCIQSIFKQRQCIGSYFFIHYKWKQYNSTNETPSPRVAVCIYLFWQITEILILPTLTWSHYYYSKRKRCQK